MGIQTYHSFSLLRPEQERGSGFPWVILRVTLSAYVVKRKVSMMRSAPAFE
jgi:hypothetical protein